jgi:hypothetical protein
MTGAIVIIGLLFMAQRAYSVAQAAQKLNVTPGTVRVLGFDSANSQAVKLNIGLNFENLTKTSVPIDRLIGEITYKGKQIGTYLINNPINIPAEKKILVTVDASINYVNLLNILAAFADTKKIPDVFTMGSVKTLGVTIPYNFNITSMIV